MRRIARYLGLGVALAILALAAGLSGTAQAPEVEDFETCDFSRFPWETGGDADWFVTSTAAHSGSCSAQAGDIDDDEITYLELTQELEVRREISFC